MRVTLLPDNPIAGEQGSLAEILRGLARADDPRDATARFLQQYARLRAFDSIAAVERVLDDPTRFELIYVLGPDELGADIPTLRTVIGQGSARGGGPVPHAQSTFLTRVTAGDAPVWASGFRLEGDLILGTLAHRGYTVCAAVPVFGAERTVRWILGFARGDESEQSSEDVLHTTLAVNLLAMTARSLEAARTTHMLHARVTAQHEEVARVQRSLVQAPPYDVPGLEVATLYETSELCGGDYFRVQHLDDRYAAVVIADVSGHGAGAAVVAAMFHAHLASCHAFLPHEGTHAARAPAAMLASVNERMVATPLSGMFVTAFLGLYDREASILHYCNAGHNEPRLVRAGSGGIITLSGGATFPLGVAHPNHASSASVFIAPGDCLVLFTDGVVELFCPQRLEQFGEVGLERALVQSWRETRCEPQSVIARIAAGMLAHRRALSRDDDQTVVVVRKR